MPYSVKGPGSIGARHVRFGRIVHEPPVDNRQQTQKTIRPLDFWARITAFDLGVAPGKGRRSLALPSKLWDAGIHAGLQKITSPFRRCDQSNAFSSALHLAWQAA